MAFRIVHLQQLELFELVAAGILAHYSSSHLGLEHDSGVLKSAQNIIAV